MIHKLCRVADVLSGEDWLVKGLTKFFEEKLGSPGHRLHDCHIVLKIGIDSFKNRPFRPVREEDDLVLREYLRNNMGNGKLNLTSSLIASPLLFACKYDGKLRLCVDYWQLNQMLLLDCYPLLRIDGILLGLRDKRVFTKLELRDVDNQILMLPGSEDGTTFSLPYGNFELAVMPFGLSTAPAVF
jgi:hypothetical protein